MEISPMTNPISLFSQWFSEAGKHGEIDPTAMTLATSDSDGWSMARIVLLKGHSEEGFSFYTNFNSDKSQQLLENPKAALTFHWRSPFHRQIRIRGLAKKISYEESNEYFQTRDRGSQIGAWASTQSFEISGREELLQRVKVFEDKYQGQAVPCPESWGGFLVEPLVIEFWQEQPFRLHDRFQFSRISVDELWKLKRLAP